MKGLPKIKRMTKAETIAQYEARGCRQITWEEYRERYYYDGANSVTAYSHSPRAKTVYFAKPKYPSTE